MDFRKLSCSFLVVLASCYSGKMYIIEKEPLSEMLLFVTIEIEKRNDLIEGKLIFEKWLEGSIEKTEMKSYPKSDYACAFYDANGKIVEKITIEPPFEKNAEYFDVDGLIKRKTIDLDKSKISLRVNIKPIAKYLVIHDSQKEILRLSLNNVP